MRIIINKQHRYFDASMAAPRTAFEREDRRLVTHAELERRGAKEPGRATICCG
jgi:hypothetical protein